MDTRRDIGGPERLAALANSADGYGKRPIKFHSLPSRQMTSDIIMPRARDPCHHEEPRREKGTAVLSWFIANRLSRLPVTGVPRFQDVN